MQIYNLLLCVGVAADLACSAAVISRRAYKAAPLLSLYIIYSTIADAAVTAFYFAGAASIVWTFFLCFSVIGYLLEFGVAYEAGRRMIRSGRGSMPRHATAKVALAAMALCISVICVVGGVTNYEDAAPLLEGFLRVEFADGLCRSMAYTIVLVLILAAARRAPDTSQPIIYLALYFDVALICQYAHEGIVVTRQSFDYYERIEIVRMTAWAILMALVAKHLLSGRTVQKATFSGIGAGAVIKGR